VKNISGQAKQETIIVCGCVSRTPL